MSVSRRNKLTALIALLLLLPFVAAATPPRGYIGGGVITLTGLGNTLVKSVQGGNPMQQPTVRGQRSDKYPDKVPGALRFEDATFELPVSAPSVFWEWVNAAAGPRDTAPKRMVLSEFDYTNREISHLIFEDCALRALELPACDSTSKSPGFLKLTVAPVRVIDAAVDATAKPAPDAKLKTWKSSGFRLSIDGLDATAVTKIEPLTIKRIGRGLVEYSNLIVTVADTDLDEWKQWSLQGFEGKPAERNGKLEYLSTDRTATILSATFEGLGIVRLQREKYDPSIDPTRRTRVELYVEKVTFVAPSL
ncbi:MAG TPA: hypothetical protein VKP30_32190 [Polyangiaceae bacterium]|nr:hypothetical protein [Polyangiaceae bacterium]